ncbi:MAG: N-acetyl sugar amidotransferase [Candidatus Omnitrophica bacterium]|nr:N-acetyl sugar amidotransferase [Candidatus Omnitrophota bacterium]
MEYCKKCVYPKNTAVKLDWDDEGVCSGCRYFEELDRADWKERRLILDRLLDRYRNSGNTYDCIIPVSGGKDSHYQTYLIKEVYGLNPLLVTFNHICSPLLGIKNMANIVEKFKVDHIRYTPNPEVIRKLMKYTLKKMGDACWFCQTGVVTVPIQIAVRYRIPLIVWGEHGWSHLFGKSKLSETVKFSTEERTKLFMRGLSVDQVLKDNPEFERRDLSWAIYPSEEEIQKVGISGIYLGNYLRWNQKEITEFVIKNFGFKTRPKARTYNTYADVDCHLCSGTNDYLKYLKYGYGRATDHVSQDIREGRITRQEGIKLLKKYEHVRPEDLDTFFKEMDLTEEELMKIVEPMRDPNVWQKQADGSWAKKVSIDPDNLVDISGVEEIEKRLNFVKNWAPEELDPRWHF